MKRVNFCLGGFLSAGVLTAAVLADVLCQAAATEQTVQLPRSRYAWTYEEAREQLLLHPWDVYLQYVVWQLARQEGKKIELWQLTARREALRREVDLLALFSAAHAIQESLQMDTLVGERQFDPARLANPAENQVPIAEIHGPQVKSHPWEKMLAQQLTLGKKPDVSPLSLCVPADQYLVEFSSVNKMLEVLEALDRLGDHVFVQAVKSAQSQRSRQRIQQQLAVQTDPLTRPFYDLVVEQVAITGNDLYFREGTDITLLFLLKQPQVFQARMDSFLTAAEKSRPDAVRSIGQIEGISYTSITTPDRTVHVFSAYPKPNLHVRSNSKLALERVLRAIAGDPQMPRLGETAEFKYIRTLMQRGDPREDGFVYLSDPFIRRMIGPQVKLTEARRMICYNHLRMIGHAAMLYQTQYGKKPQSLQDLVDGGCAPAAFTSPRTKVETRTEAEQVFCCPCGGTYSLAPDGLTGVCSHHGRALEMVPCLDIPLERVTDQEADQYKRFVDEYDDYWRQFFDPIVLRIKVDKTQYRLETLILPLIDNSIYTGLARLLGGEPENLEPLPLPKRTIFSIAFRLDKKIFEQTKEDVLPWMLREILVLPRSGLEKPSTITAEDVRRFLMDGLGNQISLHICDAQPMFDFNTMEAFGLLLSEFRWQARNRSAADMLEFFPFGFLAAALNAPTYIALPVQKTEIVDEFLDKLDKLLAQLGRAGGGDFFFPAPDFYKTPLKGTQTPMRVFSIGIGPIKWRLYLARIGSGLYVASKPEILEDLLQLASGQMASSGNALAQGQTMGTVGAVGQRGPSQKTPGLLGAAPKTPTSDAPVAHGMVRIRPENWNQVLADFQLGWAESGRRACLNNLPMLSSAARALAALGQTPKPEEVLQMAQRLYGMYLYCPDGGRYEPLSDRPEVVCSVHGSAAAPRQAAAPAAGSALDALLKEFAGLTAELTFLEDGLHAVLTIRRK
ncbi:MAG: hypothetical protein NZ602_06810 [Thermoguttaceae bacterium]|nr:hypothetical protein [Thermoguttaceae bacterium]MDW8038286.1 hypothetical protein [Thermoguttaceae bacterium]